MSTSVKAVLFDVDGTLVDTNYLHTVAWWEAFAQAGHDVPMAPIHRAIGMGSDKLLGALLPPGRDTSEDEDIKTSHAALYSVYGPGSARCPERRICCGPVMGMGCGWSWPARRTRSSSRYCARCSAPRTSSTRPRPPAMSRRASRLPIWSRCTAPRLRRAR